jgi:hypothetical protein
MEPNTIRRNLVTGNTRKRMSQSQRPQTVYYRLDDNYQPAVCSRDEYHKWIDELHADPTWQWGGRALSKIVVAGDWLMEKNVAVSTTFEGVHQGEQPDLWVTHVYEGASQDGAGKRSLSFTQRHPTRDAALAGHVMICRFIMSESFLGFRPSAT